jgi:hypothetical protein
MLADAIGQADAILKGAEAEVAALKSEFKSRGLRVVAGGHFTITCLDQIAGRLDISAVKIFLGDAWRQFETPRRLVTLQREGAEFVVSFNPQDIVVFRHTEPNALLESRCDTLTALRASS